MANIGDVVLPGDTLKELRVSEVSGKAIVGPGLRKDSQQCQHDSTTEKETSIVTKPGILRFKEPNVYWVDSHQKRYIPTKGDNVIGVVTAKAGDVFRVDVGGSEQASLSYLAFDGASKKNRPDVKVGDILFARFLVANKDMEPELVCIDSTGRSSGMGVIRDGGFLLRCTTNLVKKLLSKECSLLKTLGTSLPYEAAVGLNGRIWIKGRSIKETIAIVNAIESAEYMTNQQMKVMVRKLLDALAGF